MKLYKKMVRPYSVGPLCQGFSVTKTPLAEWIDEEEKTELFEKMMEQKCKEYDCMSKVVWEEKYEAVGLFGAFIGTEII